METNPMKRHIDLSHVIESGMITYKGFPAPLVCDYMSREESRERYDAGTEFQIGKIEMIANTGTYIDSPFHRYENGDDIADLRLKDLVGIEALVFRSSDTAISPEIFNGVDFRGKAVLVNSGWDKHWRTDAYFENHPHLTREAALFLADGGASIVGIDSFNIDSVATRARPVHTVLLGHGIPIIEHMCNLGELPDAQFALTAAPVAVRGMGSFPVRAFATIYGSENATT
jgi:arylformamidase